MAENAANTQSLPVLEFDWKDQSIQRVAENIWHAQMAGWPKVLTYDCVSKAAKSGKRYNAMDREGVLRIEGRDEYPFACTREHQGSVWVGHVPREQNTEQGHRINAFLRENGAYASRDKVFRFEVRVTNYYPAIKAKQG